MLGTRLTETRLIEAVSQSLMVFGGGRAPGKYRFYFGDNAYADFIAGNSPPNITKLKTFPEKMRAFLDSGYVFVLDKDNALYVTGDTRHIGPEGLKKLEFTFKTTPDTPVHFLAPDGTVQTTTKAAQAFYGQPEAKAPEKDHAGQAIYQGVFGRLVPPGGVFNKIASANSNVVAKELKQGRAFVLRYADGSIKVVTPEQYRFSSHDIAQIESQMNIQRNMPVEWFIGSLEHAGLDSTAAEAIWAENRVATR